MQFEENMALTNFRGKSMQSVLFRGVSGLVGPKYWLTGIAFLAIYIALNILTEWHEFDRLGITMWSPDNGLSLALLTESAAFAPFVFLGAILTDVFIAGVHHNAYVIGAAELLLTIVYVIFASVLRFRLKFDIRQINLSHVVAFLMFVPIATLLSSSLYCTVLYLGDVLSADKFLAAVRHFWIGDTLGMITVIPAVTSVLAFLSKPRWRFSVYTLASLSVFILGTLLGIVALVGVGDRLYYLFNLLFLPIIWMAMREGYAGVALALIIVQLLLAVITVFMNYSSYDFAILQLLMLVLSITGLLLGVVTTERRNADLLLREQQTELARTVAYAKAGAMGTAFAHEISQPLSTVATYLHAARRLLQSGIASERVMDALVKAEAESQRAREILERIRDFVSTGALNLQTLDLAAAAQKIAALYREEAVARGTQVEIESVPPVPLVRADRVQMEQVLSNLLANAIDAASERSDARGRVVIRVAAHDGTAMIEVEDNGPGVAAELAASIFEAYQTTKPRGMGLGLPLSLRIVQAHAGRLWWEPNRPDGARFIVELPIDGFNRNAA
jgi:two-component system, LuxR family, sensor kinase FixL